MRNVLLATSARNPDLTRDDRVMAAALRARGVEVAPLIWSSADPSSIAGSSVVVVRSCWDYHMRPEAFLGWLSDLGSAGVKTINDVDLLKWNLHKSYLLELGREGVAIPPTVVLERGPGSPKLDDLLRTVGWEEAVVKPAVSLSAYETWRVDRDTARGDQSRVDHLRHRHDVVLQQFVPEVTTSGEWSLVFFGREYSHSVLKLPARGDFRVQQEHGGTVRSAVPPSRLVDAAGEILDLLPETPTYARVDVVEVNSRLTLMELECIDPVLYFEHDASAADRFADHVLRTISDR